MVDQKKPGGKAEEEKTFIKGIGFCALGGGSNTGTVDVKDGKIVRIRPFHLDRDYDKETFNPWKIEARGKVFDPGTKSTLPPYSVAYKKRVYSPNRILYPLKRADWDPNGKRNTENRGKSGYVRISWDEALDIIVSEIKRIQKEHGPYSILIKGDGHGESKVVHGCHGCNQRLFKVIGCGFTEMTRSSDSWEGWYWGSKHVWGVEPLGMAEITNTFPDIAQNTDILLHWGADAEATPWAWAGQVPSQYCYWFTELGIKQIFISPDLNYSGAVHADRWIPILPNTDAAMQLAIAYVWMTEGTYDKDYIATHTVGYERFEAYVLGQEDGVPKTPQWASPKCGVPSRIIKALAREWAAKKTSVMHCTGGSYIRGPYAHEPGRLEVLLLAMQGIGRPGVHQSKFLDWGIWEMPEQVPIPRGKALLSLAAAYRGWDFAGELQKQFVPRHLLADAVLNPPISWHGTPRMIDPIQTQFMEFTYPVEGCSEIHMIWSDQPCQIGCWLDSNSAIKAFRSPKIEFTLMQQPWFENDCRFADILLPVNTKYEEEDIESNNFSGQYNSIYHEKQCIESIGESKSDYEIACMIAERLGVLEEFTQGKSIQDWIKVGFETSGAQDFASYEEFMKKGYTVIPTDPDWDKSPVGMSAFRDDPENHPLQTPSGKIEFYSERLDLYFPGDEERPPVPHWVEKSETHDERISSDRAKKYPLLLVSNHPRWRLHVQHDDITWLREIPNCKVRGSDGYQYEPVWINPMDAAKRGIKGGDVVKISNERGAVLGGAYVTERIMPGAVSQDHGARYDPIVVGELDRGGSNNTISPHNTTSKNASGIPTSGFLVEVERVDINEMRKKYPEAFQRHFDKDVGPGLESFLYGGK